MTLLIHGVPVKEYMRRAKAVTRRTRRQTVADLHARRASSAWDRITEQYHEAVSKMALADEAALVPSLMARVLELEGQVRALTAAGELPPAAAGELPPAAAGRGRVRAHIPRAERDRRIRVAIKALTRTDPTGVTLNDVAREAGIPRSTVGKSRPWRDYTSWRSSRRKDAEVRTVALSGEMLATIAGRDDDPADIAAEREVEMDLDELIREQKEDGKSDGWRPKGLKESGDR